MKSVQTIIEKAYRKVNGEYESVTEGSEDFNTYLNVLNEVVEVWARWPYVKWQSLFDIEYTLPDTINATQLAYELDDSNDIEVGNTPFDNVLIMDGETVVKRYKLVDQALFQTFDNGDICALFGNILYFKEIDESIVGYSIRLPAYVMPSEYTSGSQLVNIDNASWLSTYMAASICDASPVPFIARNADKFYKQADILMKSMKENNRHRQHLVIKRAGSITNGTKNTTLSAAIDAGIGIGIVNGGTN